MVSICKWVTRSFVCMSWFPASSHTRAGLAKPCSQTLFHSIAITDRLGLRAILVQHVYLVSSVVQRCTCLVQVVDLDPVAISEQKGKRIERRWTIECERAWSIGVQVFNSSLTGLGVDLNGDDLQAVFGLVAGARQFGLIAKFSHG